MKWFLLLIPLLFYSVISFADDNADNFSSTPEQCSASPVLYHVGMHNYWNDSKNVTHAYYEGCEYVQKGVGIETSATGYFGDWYPTGNVQKKSGQGSGSHPSNVAGDVDFSGLNNPVLSCSGDKPYNRSGNTTGGKSSVVYSGCLYSVKYDSKSDITHYEPLSKADPVFYVKSEFSDYDFDDDVLKSLNFTKSDIDFYISNVSSGLQKYSDDSSRYYNDYNSGKQLLQVLQEFRSAVSVDIKHVKKIGDNVTTLSFYNSKTLYYVIDSYGMTECRSGADCDSHLADNDDPVKVIYYHNPDLRKHLSELLKCSEPCNKLVYVKSVSSLPYKPVFNYTSYNSLIAFLRSDQNDSSDNRYLHLLLGGPNYYYYLHDPAPFMDFSNQAVTSPVPGQSGDTSSGGGSSPSSPDTPAVTPPVGGGSSGAPGGMVTPPSVGSGGDTGGTTGTVTPDTGSQCKAGAPGWPDCDDQSGQPGGGGDTGDTGSGGDITGGAGRPSSGATGAPVNPPGGSGVSGGGYGSGGSGHGGGAVDGDGDAILKEVQAFHHDVNEALKPGSSSAPDFNNKDADFSDVRKDIDKQASEQSAGWVDGANKLQSTLNGLSGSLPSTKLDMSGAVPSGITGVCRPWEFDVVIGLPGSSNFKQHVVMTQFCTWYDTYIRPFVTWSFNFLTAVAVFNILYKGLRTVS